VQQQQQQQRPPPGVWLPAVLAGWAIRERRRALSALVCVRARERKRERERESVYQSRSEPYPRQTDRQTAVTTNILLRKVAAAAAAKGDGRSPSIHLTSKNQL
jgi:hypothetical protein